MVGNSAIIAELHCGMIKTDTRTPQIYCLPKIDLQARHVTATGSVTHPLVRHITQTLRGLVTTPCQ